MLARVSESVKVIVMQESAVESNVINISNSGLLVSTTQNPKEGDPTRRIVLSSCKFGGWFKFVLPCSITWRLEHVAMQSHIN